MTEFEALGYSVICGIGASTLFIGLAIALRVWARWDAKRYQEQRIDEWTGGSDE